MLNTTQLNTIIETFNNWQQPWTFFEAIKTTESLADLELKTLDAIWAVACDQQYWQESAPDEAILSVKSTLSLEFAWLSHKARQHVANAAAYQWK